MSSTFDKNLLPEFDSVKDNDEEILWTGKPKFVPYIFSGLGTGLFTLAFGLVWVLVNFNIKPDNADGGFQYFWLFGLIPLLQGLYVFLNRLLSFSNTAYGYSNKRVMMRTGFIGTDFNYPNALRPETNPGYKTKYDRKN